MSEPTEIRPADNPPPQQGPKLHGQRTGKKTRWCEACKKRHELDHEHFKGRGDRAADTVTGAKSAADLAQRALQSKTRTDVQKQIEKLQKEQEAELREALERRWGRRCRLVYSVWARIADDPKLRLTDLEEKDFGQVHADFAFAWGLTSSTKLEATLDVLTMHGTAVAARSKWVQDALAGLKKEKETLEEPRPE